MTVLASSVTTLKKVNWCENVHVSDPILVENDVCGRNKLGDMIHVCFTFFDVLDNLSI